MDKPIISFDVDGVLLNTSEMVIGWAEEQFPGLSISEADIHCWEFSQAIGMTKGMYKEMWKEFYSSHLTPIMPSIEVVRELRKRGYNVIATTARNKVEVEVVLPTLMSPALFNIGAENIHSCPAEGKADFLDKKGVVAHVDDKWQTASDLGEIWDGAGRISYLFSRPWNRSLDLAVLYKRINNYQEILNDFQ